MKTNHLYSCLLLSCLISVVGFGTVRVCAGETKFQAVLIWGTDEEKPKDPNLKEVDSKVVENLKKVFKWKSYFEVKKRTFAVADLKSEKVKLSEKCEVEVKNLGKSMIEVRLYGEGKLVKKVTQSLPAGKFLVLAGDDKDDTAWFVVLSPQ